jgi:hypothetical protein
MMTTVEREDQIQTMESAQSANGNSVLAIQPDGEHAENTEAQPAAHEEGEYIPDVHLPDPSIWPFVMALGLAILMAGIVLHLLILVAGLAVFVFGLGGWLYQDIQVARRSEHH